jgi:hypothetical protein
MSIDDQSPVTASGTDTDEINEIDEIDEIESILRTAEPDLLPSPGFTRRVMESVLREAARPAPIPFPWLGLLGGVAASAAVIAAGTARIAALSRGAAELHLPALAAGGAAPMANALGWALAAVGGSYLLTWLARRLVRTS